MAAHDLEQISAHLDQELHAVRQAIERPQHAQARGNEGSAQAPLRMLASHVVARRAHGRDARVDGLAIDVELGEHLEESLPSRRIQRRVTGRDVGRARPQRDVTVGARDTRRHIAAQRLDFERDRVAEQRLGEVERGGGNGTKGVHGRRWFAAKVRGVSRFEHHRR